MENRDNFLNALKIESQNQKSAQKFTSKKGTLSKIIGNHKLKLAAGLMAVMTPFIISGCSGHVNTPTTQATPSTTIDDSSNQLSGEYSILQDFKQRYLAEYNKVNGTDFGIYDIELHMIPQSYLYVTYDKQYITHGQYPDKTREILVQYDNNILGISSEFDSGYVNLLQITTWDDKHLEAAARFFPRGFGDMISTPVLSATDDDLLSKLNSKEGLKENTLHKYYTLAEAVMNIFNAQDKNSKKIYIRDYNEAIREMDNPTTSFEKE